MSFELKGAYSMLLDLIYMSGGQLSDEPRFIAGHMNCSVRAWGNYRAELISKSKIRVENGIISNFRADKELIIQRSFQDKQRENRLGKRKNNDLTQTTVKPKDNHTDTDTDKKEERDKSLSRPSADFDDCLTHFNATADRVGWPKVQRLTATRKAALSHRISDCGGEGAWRDAIERAARSPLLTGQTGRGWRADFDWLCKAANFTKLMEGNYDPRPETDQPTRMAPNRGSGMVEAFAAVAAARSGRA
jgi:uncharacterized protein YdaU (DUF1376 family)